MNHPFKFLTGVCLVGSSFFAANIAVDVFYMGGESMSTFGAAFAGLLAIVLFVGGIVIIKKSAEK